MTAPLTVTPTHSPGAITWTRVDGRWIATLVHTTTVTLPVNPDVSPLDLERAEEFLRSLDDVLDACTDDALQMCSKIAAKAGAK